MLESDKIMFEIYRETRYTQRYKVVYFTELHDHNRETEINRALAGDHFFDGFLQKYNGEEAKRKIDDILGRLNRGEKIRSQDVEQELAGYLV